MIGATLDSNIYISALEFRGAGTRLLSMARAGSIRIDTSNTILNETIGVLRDKFRWDGYRLHFARHELLRIANCVEPKQTIDAADDPDDNRVLECAIEAGSDCIVTNDTDLLRLGEYQEIKIVRPDDFLRWALER
ncbi:MAG: putative toxin-antitoxin system toxin component, PIN family [Acidobacteria bacterium]|nr:putative toxin-antitoxin system toxin component, PIN family [Acidobacteriota bacterium]